MRSQRVSAGHNDMNGEADLPAPMVTDRPPQPLHRVLIVAVPAYVAISVVVIAPVPASIAAAFGGYAVVLIAAVTQRMRMFIIGAAMLAVAMLAAAMTARETPVVFAAFGAGLATWVTVEAGYDQIVLFRVSSGQQAARLRRRQMLGTGTLSAATAVVVAILGVNLRWVLASLDRIWLAIPAGLAATVVLLIIARRMIPANRSRPSAGRSDRGMPDEPLPPR